MTIEEAKSEFNNYGYTIGEQNSIVDRIYDDFENRTCISCKHFELDKFEANRGTCRNKNTPTRNFMVDCDYGCNRYEAKENK